MTEILDNQIAQTDEGNLRLYFDSPEQYMEDPSVDELADELGLPIHFSEYDGPEFYVNCKDAQLDEIISSLNFHGLFAGMVSKRTFRLTPGDPDSITTWKAFIS